MEKDWLYNMKGGQRISKPDFSLNVISFLLVLEMGGFMVVRTYFDKNDTRKSCPVDTIQTAQCIMLCRNTSSCLLEVMCLYYLPQIYEYTQSSNTVQWILNQAYSANKQSCLDFI